MMRVITVKQVGEATNAKLFGENNAAVSDVTHDSRQAGTGALFVAVRGSQQDFTQGGIGRAIFLL